MSWHIQDCDFLVIFITICEEFFVSTLRVLYYSTVLFYSAYSSRNFTYWEGVLAVNQLIILTAMNVSSYWTVSASVGTCIGTQLPGNNLYTCEESFDVSSYFISSYYRSWGWEL